MRKPVCIFTKAISVLISVSLLFLTSAFKSCATPTDEKIPYSKYFYSQLSESEKIIYDELVSTKCGLEAEPQGEIKIKLPKASVIKALPSESAIKNALQKALAMAFSATAFDHPEFYWMGDYSYGYAIVKKLAEYRIEELTVYIAPDTSWSTTEQRYNSLIKAAREIEITGDTAYERVLCVHDAICKRAFYPEDLNEYPLSGTACGALLYPYAASCGGYSGAFKIVCSLNNIECICVFGESVESEYLFGLIEITSPGYHEWNYVKMDDGNWYGVDVTWDDAPKSGISHEYLLSGSETTAPSFDSKSFEKSHKPTGNMYGSGVSLSYPQISKAAYPPKFLPSMLGDVNMDKRITVTDAKSVLKAVAGMIKLEGKQLANADINGDAVVSVADAKIILKTIADIN